MATRYSPKIVTNGLVLCLDAANTRSYSGSGSDFIDIAGPQGTSWSRGAIDGATFIPHSSTAGPACFDFDGTNDKVTFTIPDVDIYCFQVAVKNDTGAYPGVSGHTIVGFKVDGNNYNGLIAGSWTGTMTDETLSWWGYGTGGSGSSATYMQAAVSAGWHIVTVNWNGSNYDIWLDNVKYAGLARSGGSGHSGIFDDVTEMYLGWNAGWSTDWFDGKIAFARAYNKQLTDAQILQNYTASKGRLEL
jgi:hypothetical protein